MKELLGYDTIRQTAREVLDEKVKAFKLESELLSGGKWELKYDPELPDIASERIGMTVVFPSLGKSEATMVLRNGFTVFVDHMVEFGLEKIRKSVDVTIRLSKGLFEEYLGSAREKKMCGEIPCNHPPCCDNCAPPPCKRSTAES
jgi:hypothetical protein